MSTRNITALFAKLGGLSTALLLALLLPISISTGEGGAGSVLPVRLSDACADSGGYCAAALGYECTDFETGSTLYGYMCIGCVPEGPPGGGPGNPPPGTPGGP
jgi:hypothetical protein